jgi:hypothetical protein
MRALIARARRRLAGGVRQLHPDRELVLAEFDARFYLAANRDVARAGADPVEHFLAHGWREGRDPNRRFSLREYLRANPDVAAAGVNPFVHYLKAGRREGRKPRQDLGFRYAIIAGLTDMETRIAEAARAAATVRAQPEADLVAALARSRTGLADLHITFSHDDFTANVGGVQLCLRREARAVAEAGRDHFHIFPAKPWPTLRREDDAALLGVVWNGEAVGAFPPSVVTSALRGRAKAGSFAIHSLLGHAVDETLAILAAAGLRRGLFWLHDFASLCAGVHLLRNDVEDCAAPPPDSAACGICFYSGWRSRHLGQHERLFQALELTVVSPSESALELWRSAWRFPARGQVVLPHVRLVARGPAPAVEAERPLRVAFAGVPAAHKGWAVFKETALNHLDDPRYEFHVFAGDSPAGVPATFHPVSAGGPEPDGMRRALAEAEIDVALIWPLCRETFSFTAHEAVAAGAAVVTNPDSGNVAAFVAEGGHGRVLADEDALAAAFETGDMLSLSRARRGAKLYDLEYSALSMDLIETEAGA